MKIAPDCRFTVWEVGQPLTRAMRGLSATGAESVVAHYPGPADRVKVLPDTDFDSLLARECGA
ncbi:MAG: hypothetical protein ACEQSH_00230 [Bacteroidia bacterium]